MKNYVDPSPLFGTNAIFIEEMYQRWLQDSNAVDESWRKIFREMGDSLEAVTKNHKGASWSPRTNIVVGAAAETIANQNKKSAPATQDIKQACRDSINALMLIRAFKVRGNLLSDLDPLGLEGHKLHPDLDPATYGFSEKDYDRPVYLGGALGLETATIRQLLEELKKTYSGKIGVEFMHISSGTQRDWIANKMEAARGRPQLTTTEKKKILEDIIHVEYFEEFLHVKYPGAKRFSVEGGESAIAALEKVIEFGSELGIEEIVIGMPHRGRLNVITKVMGRGYASILAEFQGTIGAFPEEMDISGDVKYHMGTSSDRKFEGRSMHLSLTANPSHLEAVNPVVAGKVRAKQHQRNDAERSKAMGLLFHGDAAFAGQGIVAETLALGDLEGYTTGGTIHVIINNQIGFTTAPQNARKSPYPSDVAKMVGAPIFHINGDDPEAVIFATKLAVEFRQEFKKDVVLDIVCYRRHGHNEGDEPSFTQPIMYDAIRKHPTPMYAYAGKLESEGTIAKGEFDEMLRNFRQQLEKEYEKSSNYRANKADWLAGKWEGFAKPEHGVKPKVDTGIPLKKLKEVGEALASYPEGFAIHPKLVRIMEAKKEMFRTGQNIDWATGEALAFGTLLTEGHNVRLSGQDCTRGTFSHRHSGLISQTTGEKYYPLNNIGPEQAVYEVIDSNLSEFGVMGFEYGFSLAEPNTLVLWEGQFGDFANGAQVIIDQFLAPGEIKWLRMSGLVLLLPHGYEGQGPEHSSARLERYLQLCAEDNMQVVNCSTPANYFHALRRQLHRNFRKPLIVMTPKSLLRHKQCVSSLDDFKSGTHFRQVIGETEKLVADANVRRVVICSGKIYYELLEEREKRKLKDIAIIRLEQFYPFPEQELTEIFSRHKNAEFVWCQEEHKNMGGWTFVNPRIEETLLKAKTKHTRPRYAGRKEAASPAAGYMKIHTRELRAFVDEALN